MPPTTSYWLDEPRESLPERRFEGRPEVAVIGGGVTGCSCALTLAERGVRVRLYEAGEIAAGASGRNGGFALRGATAPYDQARVDLGRERAKLVMELTERSLDRMESLAGDAFRRVGSLRLAWDQAELEALRREHDSLREDGFAVEWVDTLEGRLAHLYLGAILHPHDGALYPARWVRRLARHAAEAGADIREHTAASVDELDADAIVVAGDGYTAALLPELAGAIVPTRGQVLATEALRERLYERPHYARGGYDYWHQLPDGRLVIGGQRDASFETEATNVVETTELVQGRLDELVEQLVGYRPQVAKRWAGIWGTTPDLQPLVGPVPGRDGVWVAGGYSGHGNALGLACGDLVARTILGERPPEGAIFDPDRLVPDPTGRA
ncbi:MAG TPA: FAD-dependent oxidoreductase [Gaiellaceae bacterium]|nr:FAD-dependent oxidoreductase [Gaiellaceae bacterium]